MTFIRRASTTATCLAFLLGSAAFAQRPGVGYDPHGRGLSFTHYQLDLLSSPYQTYTSVYTANPGEVGASPNAYAINLGDPAVAAAYELRYGPFTASHRFKRWAGPGNEVKFLLKNALVWFYKNHPEGLGGDVTGRNGDPTEVEVTDVQAFDDREIWVSYFQAELVGFSEGNRVTVCDPAVPPGDGQIQHPFWGIAYFYTNVYSAPLPVSPQLPGNGCPPGISGL